MKKIKNTGSESIVRCGQTLTQNVYYTIEANELSRWQNDDTVLAEIASGLLVMNDGDADIAGVAKSIDFLRDHLPMQLKPFADADGYRARFKGVSATATKGQDSNIEHTLTEDRWIDGVEMLQDGGVFGDYMKFQVVHPQAGVVDEFGDTWMVDPTHCKQGPVILSFPAKIPAGLKIRVVYHSVGTETDVWVAANLRLYKKT